MSFVLAITVVLLVVVTDAIAQIPADCLGRVWHITEGDATWAGTWTRRGNTNIFDAYWKKTTGEEQRAVLTMEVNGSQVVIQRGSDRYYGTISSDCRTIEGTASWYQSWMKWSAVIVPDDIPTVPKGTAAGCFGQVWHVTEGDASWQGTWTRRGNTNVFDAYWKRTTGEEQRAVLTMEVNGSQVVIQRGSDRYTGTISQDCRKAEGKASWYPSWMSWNATIDSGPAPPASFPPQPVQPQTGAFPPAQPVQQTGSTQAEQGRCQGLWRVGGQDLLCMNPGGAGKISGASWSQNLTWTGSAQGCIVNILPMPGFPDTYDILTLTFIENGKQLSGQNRKNGRILMWRVKDDCN
jgi:hypothetical protein